jgi:septum site-determining protein MinD
MSEAEPELEAEPEEESELEAEPERDAGFEFVIEQDPASADAGEPPAVGAPSSDSLL